MADPSTSDGAPWRTGNRLERVWLNQDVKSFVSHAINLCTFYGAKPLVAKACYINVSLNFIFLYIPEVTKCNSV